jgi:hypothetical protein
MFFKGIRAFVASINGDVKRRKELELRERNAAILDSYLSDEVKEMLDTGNLDDLEATDIWILDESASGTIVGRRKEGTEND